MTLTSLARAVHCRIRVLMRRAQERDDAERRERDVGR